jgi:hypothetical protein
MLLGSFKPYGLAVTSYLLTYIYNMLFPVEKDAIYSKTNIIVIVSYGFPSILCSFCISSLLVVVHANLFSKLFQLTF